ncbi:DUF397 domain-containing protein [Streptomyces sp. KPB2]|uniref:DUF397 domain-containing protein n=1 Tax=unclassified Streptomyces TaxID=2593676 RepID=UPI000F71AF24|nr:DUF397 domain-containing protein [Streptomyces sp. KPB2]AZM76911.1 DUF397 domain-containing protein [Streptomyces sp. KPB2]
MVEYTWQKSSFCGEGDSCIHVAATPGAVHLTESGDPTGSILTVTPTTFGALLTALKSDSRPSATEVTVATSDGGIVRVHATGTPGTAVTTDHHKWETFVRGVRAEEFDHFAS